MESKQEKKLLKKRKKESQKAASTSKTKDPVKKKNTSLRLDSKVLKALKIKAIEKDTSIQQIIETLVHDYLDKND